MIFYQKEIFLVLRKKKKINPNKRIFNKELGGGVILDLGCYPVSLSTLIASLHSEINYDKIKISNVKKDIASSDIEINSSMELTFENNFTSSLNVSYSKNIGKKTNIIGSKGEIILEDTWSAEPSIINIKKDKNKIININSNENIYSYEINFLSECILDKKSIPIFPRLTIDNIIGNMKIIDKWKS